MRSFRTFVLILTLAMCEAVAFGQNGEQPGVDFGGQDAARRTFEARERDQQSAAQARMAAQIAQEQATWELWCSWLCYLVTGIVVVLCLYIPWYAAGAVLRRYEPGKLALGVFVTLFVMYTLPLFAAWTVVAPDYAAKSAAENRIVATGRPFPFNGEWEAYGVKESRIKEVREATRLQLAWRELPNVFDAVSHAFRHQRGLIYLTLAAEAGVAALAFCLASRLKPSDQHRSRSSAARHGKACQGCGQFNGAAVRKCIQCNGVSFAPALLAAADAEPSTPPNPARN